MKKLTVLLFATALTTFTACGAKTDGDKSSQKAKDDGEYVFSKNAPFYDLDSRLFVEENAPDGATVVTEADLGVGGAERFYLYRTGPRTFDAYTHPKDNPEARLSHKFEINRVGDYTILAIIDKGRIVRAKIECNGGFLSPEFLLQRQMLMPRIGVFTDVNFPDQQPLVVADDGTMTGFYTEGPVKLEFQNDFFGAIRNIIALPKAGEPGQKAYFEMAYDTEDDTIIFTPYDRVTDAESLEMAGETGDWAFIPSEGTPFFPKFKRNPGKHEWLHTDALTSFFCDWLGQEEMISLKKELDEVKNPNEIDKWNLRLLSDMLSAYHD